MTSSVIPARSVALLSVIALASFGITVPLSSPVAAASGKIHVERDSTSQRVEFVRVTGKGADLNPSLSGRTKASSTAKTADWLADQAALFGVDPDELVLAGSETSEQGRTLTYTQAHRGLPVFGAALKANLDPSGALVSINGHVVPDLNLKTAPSVSAAKAEAAAIRLVRQDPPTDEDGKKARVKDAEASSTLIVYETGSTRGQAGLPYLAWQVEVTAGTSVREQVILDAHRLKSLNRWSDGHTALSRKLRTVVTPGVIDDPDDDVLQEIWTEGQPTDALSQKRKDLMASTGETYRMFSNLAGRDSFDGQGAEMVLVDNRADRCPNASWNGVYTSYCNGLESDDVVAHEWGHAYTEYTSGLIYQWQAGALNESFSDVWGETVDLLNDREDEGEAAISTPRADSSCAKSTAATRTATVVIESPAAIAGPCPGAAPSPNGPRLPSTPQTVQVVVGLDAANATGPITTDGCTTLSNASAVAGKWVYLDRGTCTFATKAANVKAAGGLGLLVSSGAGTAPFGPTGDSPVPEIMISQDRGDAIKSVASGTPVLVTVTGNDPVGASTDRWLVGEQATAFPGALRDMWNPNCKGDPAKVTDAQYHCATTDNGGVHVDSGVPNRAYSLAVDGGTFNGHTVTGLGLDKAAQIWWRAGASYLTPTSDFNDFASSLTQACTTLVGAPLKKLSLTSAPGATAGPITSADCSGLDDVISATELRTDPVDRCGVAARFAPGQPAGCGDGTTSVSVLAQDFDSGLADWSASTTAPVGVSTVGPSSWTTTTKAAGIHGSAAIAANPYGTCSDATSATGVSSLTSPAFTIPSLRGARATFRHTLNLEDTYDGGNVKISINGSPFSAVPTSAYTFNAPDGIIAGEGNDNPMLGQKVWTGTEQQTAGARWGTSQIDLAASEVASGDTVRIRFDLGTDMCAGLYGWLVDDIAIAYCATTTSVAATAPTSWVVGNPGQMSVEVGAVDSSTVDGEIEVRNSAGDLLGTTTLTDGSATVTLPDSIPAGTHHLKVAYLGTAVYARSIVDVPVTVTPKAPTHVTVTQPKPWTVGSTARVAVKVTASGGAPATGKVELRASSGSVLATATLTHGSAALTTPKTLKAGTQRLAVAYLGNSTSAASTTTMSVTVRATSRTSVAVSPSKPRRGKAFTLRATVKSSPGATGKITFRLNGKSLGSTTVKGGRATLKVSAKKAKKLKVSSKKNNAISAVYSGTTIIVGSKTSIRFRARK